MDEGSITDIRAFYRIVWTDLPMVADFLSHVDRNVVVRVDYAEIRRLASGVSKFCTLGRARRTELKRPPWFGRGYIARVIIPIGGGVVIERTTKTAGHYTIWGDAHALLSFVDEVEPVTNS